MQLEFLLSPIILITLVLFVAWPLLVNKTEIAAIRRSELEKTLEEKEVLIATLKDIEMDYRMGKLSDEDYQILKEDFETRAVRALQQLDILEKENSKRQS